MSAAVLSAIKHAWPDARAKRIAAALGCSVITGKRIASTGNVSSRYRLPLLRVLDETIARRRAEIVQLQDELKAIEYAEMLDRAASRRGPQGNNQGGDRTEEMVAVIAAQAAEVAGQ